MRAVMVTYISSVLCHSHTHPLASWRRQGSSSAPASEEAEDWLIGGLSSSGKGLSSSGKGLFSGHTREDTLLLRRHRFCFNRVYVICLSQDGKTYKHRMTAMRNMVL